MYHTTLENSEEALNLFIVSENKYLKIFKSLFKVDRIDNIGNEITIILEDELKGIYDSDNILGIVSGRETIDRYDILWLQGTEEAKGYIIEVLKDIFKDVTYKAKTEKEEKFYDKHCA
jgi:hypothetical protein